MTIVNALLAGATLEEAPTLHKQIEIDVAYQWQTARGATAMSFNDLQKARDWKVKQLELHRDRLAKTNLVKVTVTKVVELIQ